MMDWRNTFGLTLLGGLTFISPASVDANTTYRPIDNTDNVCWTEPVELSGKISMATDCKAIGPVLITTSNTQLDCKGGSIAGDPKFRKSGITIDSQGKSLSRVEIRNCVIENSQSQGVFIGWNLSDSEKVKKYSLDELYDVTPHDITIIDSKIINPLRGAIFVDDHVSNVIIKNNQILGAGKAAIYLNFNSTGTVVEGNTISQSGRLNRREALAIDASQNNTIVENEFLYNKYGGVFVYRNCSERVGIVKSQVMRTTSADSNVIAGNIIRGSSIGIWIASRQSRDLSRMQCGNGYYAEGKYTLDSAKNNTVKDNKIFGGDVGIRVEDDSNQIVGNIITDVKMSPILIGTKYRSEVLGKPVIGTVLENNIVKSEGKGVEFRFGSQPDKISP